MFILLQRESLAQQTTSIKQRLPYSRLFSCRFNFRMAGAGRKLDFEKFFLPI